MSDSELIRESLDRPERFDEVFERHARAIYVFICARIGPSDAEDVTADTFVAAYRARAKFDSSATGARPWLYGIAANTLRRHAEKESRWLRRYAQDDPVDSPRTEDADDRVDAGRHASQLALALASLRPEDRDVLVMYVLGDMTHAQIAEALGVRRGTAKSRLSRGLAQLRELLPDLVQQEGDE